MASNWQDFSELEKDYPEEMLRKRLEGFTKATKGLVELAIIPMEDLQIMRSGLETDFGFRLYLTSPVLQKYRFKILEFGYDVTMDPVSFKVEHEIFKEIYDGEWDDSQAILEVENVSFVSNVGESIFNSETFLKLVSGLMKIASKETGKKKV